MIVARSWEGWVLTTGQFFTRPFGTVIHRERLLPLHRNPVTTTATAPCRWRWTSTLSARLPASVRMPRESFISCCGQTTSTREVTSWVTARRACCTPSLSAAPINLSLLRILAGALQERRYAPPSGATRTLWQVAECPYRWHFLQNVVCRLSISCVITSFLPQL